MKYILKLIFTIARMLIGKATLERILVFGAKTIDVDLYTHALIQNGFTGWSNYEVTGEKYTLEKLRPYIKKDSICFDIGANDGSYSRMVNNILDQPIIYAFEPVPATYEIAANELEGFRNIQLINKATSNYNGFLTLFNDSKNHNAQISSAFAKGLTDFYDAQNLSEVKVEVITIDDFCEQNKINNIDFIKIDVEGAELAVLEGCSRLINSGSIKFIQFEFNDFNIISKTFIKDFYELLLNYHFFRINSSQLFPLGKYDTKNEIFKYQNILAVHSSITLND